MSKEVTEEFFSLNQPSFDCVSEEMFSGVKLSYGDSVVEAIKKTANENMDDAIRQATLVLAEMIDIFTRQRRDYGIGEEYPEEYPVFDQAANMGNTPIHNLAMERQCGLVDHRLKKLQNPDMVQEYMDDNDVAVKVKQKILKLKLQFARERSTVLPQIDPLLKIQITLPTKKKRREKTADEFVETLMA